MTKRIALTIYASTEQAAALRVLDEHGELEPAIGELLTRAVDGVTRPMSWERAWVTQVFGPAWQGRMEADPTSHWLERPRRDLAPYGRE